MVLARPRLARGELGPNGEDAPTACDAPPEDAGVGTLGPPPDGGGDAGWVVMAVEEEPDVAPSIHSESAPCMNDLCHG